MAGLFDVEKELARLGKQRAKIEKDLAGVVARLTNPKFLEKASQVCVRGGGRGGGEKLKANGHQETQVLEGELCMLKAIPLLSGLPRPVYCCLASVGR